MEFTHERDFAKSETVFISFYRTTDKTSYGVTVFKNIKVISNPHWLCLLKKTGKTKTPIEETLQEVFKEVQATVPGEDRFFLFDSYLKKGLLSSFPVIETWNLPSIWPQEERFFSLRSQPISDQIRAFRDDQVLPRSLSIQEDLLVQNNPFHEQAEKNLLDDRNSDLPSEYPITQSFLLFYTYLREMMIGL